MKTWWIGICLCLCGCANSGQYRKWAPQEPDRDLVFRVQPSGWLSVVDGNAVASRTGGPPVDVRLGDGIADAGVDGALHAEVRHRSGLGIMAGYGVSGLATDRAKGGGVVLDADLTQSVAELFIAHRRDVGGGWIFTLYGGVRYWEVDLDYSVSPGMETSRRTHWYDAVAGTSSEQRFNKNWSVIGTADIGGFGLESDLAWNVQGGLRYRLGDALTFDLTYKALSVRYEEGGGVNSFRYDAITHGPVLSLGIEF